ncbi:MAG: hypothetical protein GY753_10625, partial [Gammaproteobacteria bacterium]|nr:hypothetical protein [Gammaproteobacteria bacterium]
MSEANAGTFMGVMPEHMPLALNGKELQQIAAAASGLCYYTVVCHLPGGVEEHDESKTPGSSGAVTAPEGFVFADDHVVELVSGRRVLDRDDSTRESLVEIQRRASELGVALDIQTSTISSGDGRREYFVPQAGVMTERSDAVYYLIEYRALHDVGVPGRYMDFPAGIHKWKLPPYQKVLESEHSGGANEDYQRTFPELYDYCANNIELVKQNGFTADKAGDIFGIKNHFTRLLGVYRVFSAIYAAHCRTEMLDEDEALWMKKERGEVIMGSIPAEFHVYLGGQRVVKRVQGGCGLAALAYLEYPQKISWNAHQATILKQFADGDKLGEWLIDVRSRVEYASTVLSLSSSKLGESDSGDEIPTFLDDMLLSGRSNVRTRLGHADAALGDDLSKGRGRSGVIVKLGGGPVHWGSHMQPAVTDSSQAAEL